VDNGNHAIVDSATIGENVSVAISTLAPGPETVEQLPETVPRKN